MRARKRNVEHGSLSLHVPGRWFLNDASLLPTQPPQRGCWQMYLLDFILNFCPSDLFYKRGGISS